MKKMNLFFFLYLVPPLYILMGNGSRRLKKNGRGEMTVKVGRDGGTMGRGALIKSEFFFLMGIFWFLGRDWLLLVAVMVFTLCGGFLVLVP